MSLKYPRQYQVPDKAIRTHLPPLDNYCELFLHCVYSCLLWSAQRLGARPRERSEDRLLEFLYQGSSFHATSNSATLRTPGIFPLVSSL